MGYQYGEVLLSSGGKERGFILNGRSFVTRDELSGLTPIAMARAENEAMSSNLEIKEARQPAASATLAAGWRGSAFVNACGKGSVL